MNSQKNLKKKNLKIEVCLLKKLKCFQLNVLLEVILQVLGWKDYQKTGTICGLKLPEGLKESEKLPEPIFTPSTKAEFGDHDENISFEKCKEILGEELATKVKDATIAIYKKCADYAYSKGIIIADTKFEFGLDENGNLVLADEVLTPDSSRFWPLDSYEVGKSQKSYDKQYLRDWLSSNGYRNNPPERLPEDVINTTRNKYIEAYESLTGKIF